MLGVYFHVRGRTFEIIEYSSILNTISSYGLILSLILAKISKTYANILSDSDPLLCILLEYMLVHISRFNE